MSEYWVSNKKYFCRYCEIYIADDVPSRQQHENGLRHKGNTERFIRGLYKAGEKRKKDLDDEKREMARVERAAQAAFAHDVGAGLAKPSTPKLNMSAASSAPRKPSTKPANPYANYSTAASLGFKDPDVERLAADAERRRTQGVAGEWEIVTPTAQPVDEVSTADKNSDAVDSGSSLKREADVAVDDEDDSRQFKLRKKTLGGGLGEIYDPGIIPIKLKKKEEPVESTTEIVRPAEESKSTAPKWTKVQWKRAVDDVKQEHETGEEGIPPANGDEADVKTPLSSEAAPANKTEDQHSLPPLEQDTKEGILSRSEESPSAPPNIEGGGNLFRKRKIPTGTTRGKRHV